uniref:NADH dehydrogenase [ubiquinone] 1 beta subcomplex subunit 11, mitochondrial n=1 Tax=Ascaris lumbricoides TaxID=6252 RepID=A0A0M3I2F5_ASCLU
MGTISFVRLRQWQAHDQTAASSRATSNQRPIQPQAQPAPPATSWETQEAIDGYYQAGHRKDRISARRSPRSIKMEETVHAR